LLPAHEAEAAVLPSADAPVADFREPGQAAQPVALVEAPVAAPTPVTVPTTSTPQPPAETAAPPLTHAALPQFSPALFVVVYLGMAAGFLAWWLAGAFRLWRLCRTCAAVPAPVTEVFRELAGSAGRGVRLLASDCLDLPLTFGWRRPVIVLPA